MKSIRKYLSAFIALSIMLGTFPAVSISTRASGVEDHKYSDWLVSGLHIKPKDTSQQECSVSDSVGRNVTKELVNTNGYMRSYNSSFPLGYSKFESADQTENDPWEIWAGWVFDPDTEAIMKKLAHVKGNIQAGGKYDGFIDTQAGSLAGKPTYGIELKHNSGSTSERKAYTETTMSGDEQKATTTPMYVDWQDMTTEINAIYVSMKGSKGNSFGKNRNYARVDNPQIFFRDQLAPTVEKIEVLGGAEYNGVKNFVCGDKVQVKLLLSEPIRCDDYDKAFGVSVNGLSDFKAVKYDEVNTEQPELIFETTVEDDINQTIKQGDMSVNVSVSTTPAKDLAGNSMTMGKSQNIDYAAVSGLVPRINNIKFTRAFLLNKSGTYTERLSLENNTIKPGDCICFEVYYNQPLKETNGNAVSSFPVNVGTVRCNADVYSVYDTSNGQERCIYQSGETTSKPYSISDDEQFTRVEYILRVPDGAQSGDEIYIPSTVEGNFWKITANGTPFENTRGNLIINDTNQRMNVNPVTTIVKSGESILPVITVDSEGPQIVLTDKNAHSLSTVYQSAADAAAVTGEKPTRYKMYFKSDETVIDSVTASLKYSPKTKPDNITTADVKSMGAYTDNLLEDMYVEFDNLPANVDSADYYVYIETDAYDYVYNKSVQRFYIAMDTKAPEAVLENGNGNGELVTENDENKRYWKFVFDVTDAATPDGLRLYYRFSNADAYSFVDEETDFTVKTENVALDEELSGTIEYYAEDGQGNKSAVAYKTFYVSDAKVCTLVNPDNVAEYLPPRDVEFTGFEAPESVGSDTAYDYLVYKINNGEYKYIKFDSSDEAATLAIPAAELGEGCVITYKRIRTIAAEPNVNENVPEFNVLYHCDAAPPEARATLSTDKAGNVTSVRVLSPSDNHPKNITSALFTLSNETDTYTFSGDDYIINGMLYANIDFTELLKEQNLPSGLYTLNVEITDANGHNTTLDALEGGKNIIIDEPKLKNIKIISAYDDAFDDTVGAFAAADDTTETAVITKDSVNALVQSGKDFTRKADDYKMTARLEMQYVGSSYPTGSGGVEYSISEDGGFSWNEYKSAEVKQTSGAQLTANTAFYDVCVPIPQNHSDGSKEYKVRLSIGGNIYPSDIAVVRTNTDITAPETSFVIDAIGSDESGWSNKIDYTTENVRYRYKGYDAGFMGEKSYAKLTKVLDGNGNEVPAERYSDFITYDVDNFEYIIYKNRCQIFADIYDFWGNKKSIDFECMYIADVEPHHDLQTADEFTYLTLYNFERVRYGAVAKDSLVMDTDAESKFINLVLDGVLVYESMGSVQAVRNGEKNAVSRIYQKTLASGDYDIIAQTYDAAGNVAETFKVMSVAGEAADIAVAGNLSGSAKNLGKTIRAVETIEFNVPVAQVDAETAALLTASGKTVFPDLDVSGMVFSTTLNAILDIKTQGDVYVVDRLRRLYHVSVDTEGTEFVEYSGYDVSYRQFRENGSISRDASHIYSNQDGIEITVTGNDGVSAVMPTVSAGFNIDAGSMADESGTQYEGYYDSLVITADKGFAVSEGIMKVASLKIKNKTNLEEYNDVIVLKTENTPPRLISSITTLRTDSYAPIRSIHIFYDRWGIADVDEYSGGSYKQKTNVNGIVYVNHTANTTYALRARDNNGNIMQTDDITIDDIKHADSLVRGVDYDIDVLDPDKNPAEEGKYYKEVYAKPVRLEGGKEFSTNTTDYMYINSESDVVFELVDTSGAKVLCTFEPPVDTTAPHIYALQNNSGEYVTSIKYSVYVSDTRSGIEKVVGKKADSDEEPTELTLSSTEGDYNVYTFTTDNADEYEFTAYDNAGNISSVTISSNSIIVGPLEIEVKQNITGYTNKNVVMTLSAADGRRIYTHIPESENDSYLSPADYIVSGNNIVFTKNGSVLAECTDEAGNRVSKLLTVTNIDKTPPSAHAVVENVTDEYGEINPAVMRVRFEADGDDYQKPSKVFLIYYGNNEEDSDKLNQQWDSFMKDKTHKSVWTKGFEQLFANIYVHDITDLLTYVDVTENGPHHFYLTDEAGNISIVDADITQIDDVSPEIETIGYNFSFNRYFEDKKDVNELAPAGTTDLSIKTPLTNENVTVELKANEPVRLFGSDSDVYSDTISKVFDRNGLYELVIEDKAGNTTERRVNVSNIDKKDIYIEYEGGDIVLFEGQEESFDADALNTFSVYMYDVNGNKVTLTPDKDYKSTIDYGGLDINNISNNVFDRTKPYTITYTAADEAGNKAVRTRRVILASNTDTVVMVNGEMPNASSCIYTSGDKLSIDVHNYSGKAVVKAAKGQYNAAKMKQRAGIELGKSSDGTYEFKPDAPGWYTVGVRTMFQDIFTVWVYVD